MGSHCHFILFISTFLLSSIVRGDNYGLVYSELDKDPDIHSLHCIMYNPNFHKLPVSIEEALRHPVHNLMPSPLCSDPGPSPGVEGAVVAVARGNCTFSEKARLVQDYKGSAALVISNEELSIPVANQTSDYNEINVTVALIKQDDFAEILGLSGQQDGGGIHVQLYAPEPPSIDYNLIVIWLLATGTVAAGAYWSGTVRHRQLLRQQKRRQKRSDTDVSSAHDEEEEEPEALDVSPKLIFIFVLMMCAMLLSLYYLFKYLVYIVIALFALASALSMYACLKPLMLRISCIGDCRLPASRLPLVGGRRPEVRRLLLGLLCGACGAAWAVNRNQPYAWVAQDILGVMFCLNMMKTIRLPNLKACVILLLLLFVYDVFFVFVTPLLTKNGQSVMVEVATGGANGGDATHEMLPMVLKVPRFASSVHSLCDMPFSLLGFGDILVPGLLVSYCYGFDLRVNSGKVYFFSTVIAYSVGLVATFVALALMATGQPALLYLVPCTLLATLAVGARRRELGMLWRGRLAPAAASAPAATPPNVKGSRAGRGEQSEGSLTTAGPSINHRLPNEPNDDATSTTSSQGSDTFLINK